MSTSFSRVILRLAQAGAIGAGADQAAGYYRSRKVGERLLRGHPHGIGRGFAAPDTLEIA